jgi:hypothetical protein
MIDAFDAPPAMMRNGIPLLRRPDGRALVTLETVNALRDDGLLHSISSQIDKRPASERQAKRRPMGLDQLR